MRFLSLCGACVSKADRASSYCKVRQGPVRTERHCSGVHFRAAENSALDRALRNALDEHLVHAQEQDEHRQHCKHRAGHHEVILAGARAAGALRPEGKDYEMQDGDVVEFMFNK